MWPDQPQVFSKKSTMVGRYENMFSFVFMNEPVPGAPRHVCLQNVSRKSSKSWQRSKVNPKQNIALINNPTQKTYANYTCFPRKLGTHVRAILEQYETSKLWTHVFYDPPAKPITSVSLFFGGVFFAGSLGSLPQHSTIIPSRKNRKQKQKQATTWPKRKDLLYHVHLRFTLLGVQSRLGHKP